MKTIFVVFLLVISSYASQIVRVNQSGVDSWGKTFEKIQDAVDVCEQIKSCSEILITDSAVYNEQVTIEKMAGLKIRSLYENNPATIMWKDTLSVYPRSLIETIELAYYYNQKSTYDLNGALRIIESSDVEISNLKINGGERFHHFRNNVWHGMYPVNSGNVGINLFASARVHLHDLDISNAWFGIYITAKRLDGDNSQAEDWELSVDLPDGFPGAKPFQMGNHLIENNKIHDNSWAFSTETILDQGSIFRKNLVYSNYARESELSLDTYPEAEVEYSKGGFWTIKEVTQAVFQIYNNTFWNNYYKVASNYKAGYQHIFYNNIWGKPNEFVNDNWFEMLGKMPRSEYSISEYQNNRNRPTNCIMI